MKRIYLFSLLGLLLSFGCANYGHLSDVYQLTLDFPELQKYYHVDDAPDRVPLVVVKNQFTKEGIALKKFGEPVSLLTMEEIQQNTITAYFEFAAVIEKKDGSLIVNFRYPVEGVVGEVLLKKSGEKWEIVDQVMVEQ